jgi:outer membrane protein assembly factor BamB
MKARLLLLGVAVALFGSLGLAADWPQFRGPNRDGVSHEKGLLKAWPKDGPKLLWTYKDAGLGFSSFAIVGDKLYTLGTRGDDEIVLVLDANKGTELWTAKIGPIFTFKDNSWGDGPRSTPTIDGQYLYALGGQGILVCLDIAAKGKEVWRKDLRKDLGGEPMVENYNWGYSESPLVDGPLLICTPGGAQGTVAALDKKTGKVVWRSTGLTNQAPYTSPVVAEFRGVRQYIQTSYIGSTEGGVVSGFAAKDGKVLWTELLAKKSNYNLASTPLVLGDRLYISEGSGYGCHLYEFKSSPKVKDLYSKAAQKVMKNNHGGVVLVEGHVYGFSEPGMWVCQDLDSGKAAWTERNEIGGRSGSITAADNMLYLYSDEGEIGLLAADPKEFRLSGKFTIPERSKFPSTRASSREAKVWAHPVVANSRLHLRDGELIFCYDVRAAK